MEADGPLRSCAATAALRQIWHKRVTVSAAKFENKQAVGSVYVRHSRSVHRAKLAL
jgi:hypothetical protein